MYGLHAAFVLPVILPSCTWVGARAIDSALVFLTLQVEQPFKWQSKLDHISELLRELLKSFFVIKGFYKCEVTDLLVELWGCFAIYSDI